MKVLTSVTKRLSLKLITKRKEGLLGVEEPFSTTNHILTWKPRSSACCGVNGPIN